MMEFDIRIVPLCPYEGGATGALQQYSYDDASHIHAVTSIGSASPQQYGYDANGNMTGRLEASGLNRALNYDAGK